MTLTGHEVFTVSAYRKPPQRRRLADMDRWEILTVANHPDTPPATAKALYAYQYRRRLNRNDTPPEAA